MIPMSATSVGYKSCIIFSEFTMNNLFLKQSTVMGKNKRLFMEKKKVISVESTAKLLI